MTALAARFQTATVSLIDAARAVLEAAHPMTLRQTYYALVVRKVIENIEREYNRLKKALTKARYGGLIPFSWIIDPSRDPRTPAMWDDLADFASVVDQYRSDVWRTQPAYLEVWLEKDALSRIFADVLAYFGVTLNVGRGYDSTSSIGKAARRLRSGDGTTVLYYGDFDPCGEDMVRSLRERLGRLGCRPEIIKCAITPDDIVRYNLPPDPCKLGDRRTAAHIARHGDVAVELDALPVDVLRDRIRSEVEARMDLEALNQVHARDARDRERLRRAFARLAPRDGDS
jgi:hypothetical protein